MREVPIRTCIGCRAPGPASRMVRLLAPDGQLRLAKQGARQSEDEVGGARGRGAWLHPTCFASAVKSGAFSRAFRRQVVISDPEGLLTCMHAACGLSINVQGDSR